MSYILLFLLFFNTLAIDDKIDKNPILQYNSVVIDSNDDYWMVIGHHNIFHKNGKIEVMYNIQSIHMPHDNNSISTWFSHNQLGKVFKIIK